MSLTYTTFVVALSNFLTRNAADTNFMFAIPNVIDDAEQRLYRDLDLLNTVTGAVGSMTAGTRGLVVPPSGNGNGPFVVLQQVGVVTPLGSAPDAGTTTPLIPISKEALGFLYPSNAGAGVPEFFAMFNQDFILFGPWPDANYDVIIAGTARPIPLSATNPTTLLSTYFPDLFLSAALADGSGYLKEFGAMKDDPQSGMSWEKKYQMQLKSAIAEEARKKFQDQGWGSLSTGPSATPPRT